MPTSTRNFWGRSLLTLLGGLLLAAGAAAVERPPLPPPLERPVDFRRDVYPLLAEHCFRCHQGSSASSGHRLDLRPEILGETTGKPLAQPGHSDESLLIRLIAGAVPGKVMPPRGERLSPEQVGLLRAWIDQGLKWDEALVTAPPEATRPTTHWAFRLVVASAPPSVPNPSWVRNPIDAFIAARQEARGLVPAPEAPRRVLIRRLSLDLTGLPPAPEEVDAFVNDPAPDAYEKLVDRLLASPAYGERWGRHWLDVARWAESEGYESNHLRPFAWCYRDYVVRSFNDDKPYDRFVREQLAGDEMQPYSDENLIATGLLAAARLSSNEEDPARQRNDVLVDIVNTTASAFLGLTLNCAQCHDHKFDPITARDYYRFQGFFIKGQPANLTLRDPALWSAYRATVPPEHEPAEKLMQTLLDGARARLVAQARKKLRPEVLRALDTPSDQRTEEQEALARQAEPRLVVGTGQVEKGILEEDRPLFEALKKKLAAMERHVPPKPQTFGFYSPATSPTPVDVLPMTGFYPLRYEPRELARARPRLLVAGDVARRGPVLDVGWPAVFGPVPPGAVDKRPRLALADWLCDPRNPLTARVYVNRVWQYHFGRGLVATPGDFGVRGAAPTHPELLDWLAAEFVRGGWSTRRLHRLIVCSSTYRQSSRANAANTRLDPDNLLWWRWSPRRLEAEAVRDSMLAVSGELDETVGGPSVPEDGPRLTALRAIVLNTFGGPAGRPEGTVAGVLAGPPMRPVESKRLRRTLYLLQKRESPPAVQALFDGPSAMTESCPRRHVSTVPLQALYLLNDAFVVKRAHALAGRVRGRAGDDLGRQIETAFVLALGRPPDDVEREAARQFFQADPGGKAGADLEPFCQALLNLNEFVYLE